MQISLCRTISVHCMVSAIPNVRIFLLTFELVNKNIGPGIKNAIFQCPARFCRLTCRNRANSVITERESGREGERNLPAFNTV